MRKTDSSLSGKKIWVTRPAHQSAKLCRMVKARQGVPLKLPTVVIRPARKETRSSGDNRLLTGADMVIFVSKNAVIHARDLFPRLVDTLHDKTVLAVGRATAECLLALGVKRVEHMQEGGTESLLQLPVLSGAKIKDKRILIIRGQGGREALRDNLLALGADVDYLEVYRREKPDMSQADMAKIWHDETPDAVIVTSLTGLDNLVAMTPATERARLYETTLIVMSDRIKQHALKTGFTRIAVAPDNSDAGLVNTLMNMNENT